MEKERESERQTPSGIGASGGLGVSQNQGSSSVGPHSTGLWHVGVPAFEAATR